MCRDGRYVPISLPGFTQQITNLFSPTRSPYARSCRELAVRLRAADPDPMLVLTDGWYMVQPPGFGAPLPIYCDFSTRIVVIRPTPQLTEGLSVLWHGCPSDPLYNAYNNAGDGQSFYQVWPGVGAFQSLLTGASHVFWADVNSKDGDGIPAAVISNDVGDAANIPPWNIPSRQRRSRDHLATFLSAHTGYLHPEDHFFKSHGNVALDINSNNSPSCFDPSARFPGYAWKSTCGTGPMMRAHDECRYSNMDAANRVFRFMVY